MTDQPVFNWYTVILVFDPSFDCISWGDEFDSWRRWIAERLLWLQDYRVGRCHYSRMCDNEGSFSMVVWKFSDFNTARMFRVMWWDKS